MNHTIGLPITPRNIVVFVQGLAFWAAVVLAFSYPIQLLALDKGFLDTTTFLLVIAIHLATLGIGHGHRSMDR